MEPIPRHRFRILTLVREPLADLLAEELAWFRDEREVVIGIPYRDTTDGDFGYILLGRDEHEQFRWIDGGANFTNQGEATEALRLGMNAALVSGEVTFPQGDVTARKRQRLMTPVYPDERLNPVFRILATDRGYSPAASVIAEIAHAFTDPDGNFIEQFQTTGFDARLWELYLFVFLREAGCRLDRTHRAPDFVCDHFGLEFSVEAVTVNPSQAGLDPERPQTPAQIRHYNEHFTPIRFGSALLAKLRRRYWEQPHVAGRPLVLAIHDFHQPQSMIWSHSGLPTYLYGFLHTAARNERGDLVVTPVPIERHVWGNRTLRSGFFFQPDAENVSAVMFSNSATVAKFNRIGKLAKFGDPDIRMIRAGQALSNDPNSEAGYRFRMEVNDEYQESWAQGISIFHNPRARFPLDPGHFPDLLHHRFRDGQIESFHNGAFHPLWSLTQVIRPRGNFSQ
jgi:hypothetical protein